MLTLIRIPDVSKRYKKANKAGLVEIKTNKVIYVPMIAKVFDMEESRKYDNLTNEKLDNILAEQKIECFDQSSNALLYHTLKEKHDSSS